MAEVFFVQGLAEFKMTVFKMAAIIKLSVRMNEFESEVCAISCWVQDVSSGDESVFMKLSLNEWVTRYLFESKMAVAESKMTEFKMADLIKLSENEWVWVRLN